MMATERQAEGEAEKEKEQRLRAVIRYIVARCPGISMAKLSVLCFLIDMEVYRQTGKPLTGVEYINMPDDSDEWKRMERQYLYPGPALAGCGDEGGGS